MANQDQKIAALKTSLGALLVGLKAIPNTQRTNDLILAFYLGAFTTADKIPPYITMCMMSGRQDEIYILPEGKQLPGSKRRGPTQ